jgi:hypothetical protein
MPGVLFYMSLTEEKQAAVVGEILSNIKDSIGRDISVGDVLIIVDDVWAEQNNLPTDVPFVVVDLETPSTAIAMLQKPMVQTESPETAYAVIDIAQLGREETRAGVPLNVTEVYLSAQNSVHAIYNHLSEFLDQTAIEEVSEIYEELDDMDDWDDDDWDEDEEADDDIPGDHDILDEKEDRAIDDLIIDEDN